MDGPNKKSSQAKNRTLKALSLLAATIGLFNHAAYASANARSIKLKINHHLESEFSDWGQQVIVRSLKYFSRGEGQLLAGRVRFLADGQPLPSHRPATAWDQGLFILMLAAGVKNRPDDAALLHHYRRALDAYWRIAGDIGGFNADPGHVPLDRYYDDNEWITWGLLRAYRATRSEIYLKAAQADFRFVLSGRSNRLGGGIFWHEQNKNYKNTCANAPAAIDALHLFRITHHPRYLRIALALYRWVNSHLQSPRSHLFYDGERLNHSINKMEWSYNTGAMLAVNCLLYQATHRHIYLTRADVIAHAAARRWIEPISGGVRDGGPFAWVLIDGFLHLYRAGRNAHWLKTAARAMLYVHTHCKDSHGLYGQGWGHPVHADNPRRILDQAAAGGAFFQVANTIRFFLRGQQ